MDDARLSAPAAPDPDPAAAPDPDRAAAPGPHHAAAPGPHHAAAPGPHHAAAPVAMLTHSYYEEDPRVRREAEALAAAGHPVDVFALRQAGDEPTAEVDGVRVIRLDVQRHQGAGLLTYLLEYARFFVAAGFTLARAHGRRRYRLVQVHSPPDILVLAALPVRLHGVPVLLDLHEAMPEFFRMRFPRAANPIVQALLRLQERVAIGFAAHVLTVNDALVARLVHLGVRPERVTRVRNTPSLERFDPARTASRPFMADGTLRLVYTGALTPTYEVDVAIRAVGRLAEARPTLPVAFAIFGRGDAEDDLRALAAELGVADRVTFPGRIPLDGIPAAVAAADIGLAPTRRTPFTEMSLSTKILEYAAMGKPAICSDLPMVALSFGADAVWLYPSGDHAALTTRIEEVVDDAHGRDARVALATEAVAGMAWEHEAGIYREVVDRLVQAGRS